ncbi:MAG: hypothetical protein LUC41_01145, partial [Clostridiales bacterium]|nr:hypothetical protein [Clostridiales bacterium]
GSLFIFAGCGESVSEQPVSEEGGFSDGFNLENLSEIRDEAGQFDFSCENLDLSETAVIIPDVDSIDTVVFPVSTDDFDHQLEKFEYDVRKMENLEDEADLMSYLSIAYWDETEQETIVVTLDEASGEQMENIWYLLYNDGTCSAVLVFGDFMMEFGNYDLPVSLTGDEEDYSDKDFGYLGVNLGTFVESYDLPEEDISGISYNLADGETLLSDAVAAAERDMEGYYFVDSDLLDFQVRNVQVRQLSEDIFYYQFCIQASYREVPLNMNGGGVITLDEDDPVSNADFAGYHWASMFCSNKLDFIWSSCHSYESAETEETNTEFISIRDACEALSNELSTEKVYQICSLELLYETEFQYENEENKEYGFVRSVYCHPVYHFTVSNPGIAGYNSLYFYVDALTGEVRTIIGG